MKGGIHVRTHGTGPRTFVALHGWAGSGELFREVADAMDGQATVLAPDMPGYGESSRPEHWRRERIIGDLDRALRPHLQTCEGPVTLVGTCSGAVFALELALYWQRMNGPRVHRLVLFEAFAAMPWYFRLFLTPMVGALLYTLVFQNPIGRWFTEVFLRGRSSSAANDLGRLPAETTLSYLRLLDDVVAADFSELQAPVHLVAGSHTFSEIHHSLTIWRRQWPAATSTIVPGGTHLLVDESPRLAARQILAVPPTLLESPNASDSPIGDPVAHPRGLAAT
jgi:pimeloyl-ACP methyl ester carboxylesterase